MCYPSPGPRCSSHARIALTRAYRDYETEPAGSPRKGELYTVYREKRAEYFATPAGQRWLDTQIAETGDPNGSLILEKELGARTRAQALAKMQAANLTPQGHQEDEPRPEDIEELRRVERTRNKAMLDAESLMEQTRDKLEHAQAIGGTRSVLQYREELRQATNSFTQAYGAWTLAFEEVDSAEQREEA